MIISCPSCQTQFFISTPALGGGRQVRCSKCKHQWVQGPEGDDEDIPLSVMPRAHELDELDESSFDWFAKLDDLKQANPLPFAVAFVGVPLLIVALLISLVFAVREPVFPSFPDGVSLEGVEIAVGEDDVLLRGLLINETVDDHAMPIFLLQDDTQALSMIVADADQTVIPALSEVQFSASLPDWPSDVGAVSLKLHGFTTMTLTDKENDNGPDVVEQPRESQAMDTLTQTIEAAHPQGDPHHQDEHHSPQEPH